MIRNSAGRAAAIALITILAGCTAWPDRSEYLSDAYSASDALHGDPLRFWADPPVSSLDDIRTHFAPIVDRPSNHGEPLSVLAISSGSDSGAYAAGLLAGWSKSGTRPEFNLVTGVSTGALIAPFAFLGSRYDEDLRIFYTETRRKDIYRPRLFGNALTGPSLANSDPLRELIDARVTPALLDEIAGEHRAGRRLLVMTTNLDAGRGTIWDMGAIAASGRPDRLDLFRDVIQASASVPGLFTPVLISSQIEGHAVDELHADGATKAGIFVLPETVLWAAERPAALANLYLILNAEYVPEVEIVQPRSLAIISRALDLLVQANNRAAILQIYNFARDADWSYRLSAIDNDFHFEKDGWFDENYMRALYSYGFDRGIDTEHWKESP